jgi:hypothetical protein
VQASARRSGGEARPHDPLTSPARLLARVQGAGLSARRRRRRLQQLPVARRVRRLGPPFCQILGSDLERATKQGKEPSVKRTETEQKWPQSLWIVRHGQSAGNVARDAAEAAGLRIIDIATARRRTCRCPTSACAGRGARRWFGGMPRDELPDVVLSSPYVRARETARIVIEAGMRPRRRRVSDERLREKEFGILDRLTPLGIRAKYPSCRAARARRQVLFQAARRRELVRRDPAPAQPDRDDDRAKYRRGARADRRAPGHRQLRALPARTARRGADLEIDRSATCRTAAVTSYEFDPAAGSHGKLVRRLENFVSPLPEAGAPVTSEPDVPGRPKS